MNGAKKTCMIVDDDFLIRKYLGLMIEEFGYELCGVAGGAREAVEKAVQLKPDTILMDVRLEGEMDGVDASLEIYPQVPTRIIFITGSAEPDTMARIHLDHPHAILIKPIGVDQLQRALAS